MFGQVTKITDWQGNPACAAEVSWESGTKGTYRLGYQGKVFSWILYVLYFVTVICLHLLISFESRFLVLSRSGPLSVTQHYALGRGDPFLESVGLCDRKAIWIVLVTRKWVCSKVLRNWSGRAIISTSYQILITRNTTINVLRWLRRTHMYICFIPYT